jgi:hypothetical protein
MAGIKVNRIEPVKSLMVPMTTKIEMSKGRDDFAYRSANKNRVVGYHLQCHTIHPSINVVNGGAHTLGNLNRIGARLSDDADAHRLARH